MEHRLVGRLALSVVLVLPVFRGGTRMLVGGVVWARCWVLRERACSAASSAPASWGTGVLSYVWDWPGIITHSLWVWLVSVWVGSARSLRTAQWTRASLFLICRLSF